MSSSSWFPSQYDYDMPKDIENYLHHVDYYPSFYSFLDWFRQGQYAKLRWMTLLTCLVLLSLLCYAAYELLTYNGSVLTLTLGSFLMSIAWCACWFGVTAIVYYVGKYVGIRIATHSNSSSSSSTQVNQEETTNLEKEPANVS